MMTHLPISLLQTSPYWEDIPKNLRLFDEKIALLDRGQIVVLPEMFNTGFSMNAKKLAEPMDGQTTKWMKEKAAEQQIILTGSLIINENGHYYNRLLWVLPNGTVSFYDKRHLFSYAGENKPYSAGNKRLIAGVSGWKIALFICYDLRFPVWLRQLKEPDAQYDLMIVVANWPESRITAWDSLLKARAIENQCFVAGVNRTGEDGEQIAYNGHSAIYDPLGQQLQMAGKDEDVLQQVLKKETLLKIRKQYPFLPDSDPFTLL